MTNRLLLAATALVLFTSAASALDLSQRNDTNPPLSGEIASPGDAFFPDRPEIERQATGEVAMTTDGRLLCHAAGGRYYPVFNDDREIVGHTCVKRPRR